MVPFSGLGGCGTAFGRLRLFWSTEIQFLKSIVYVDGFNLYYALRKLASSKWLDPKALIHAILPQRHEVVKIKYFTARVKSSARDRSKPERQKIYWDALKTIPELEVIEGRFKKRSVKGKFLNPPERGIQRGDIVEIEKYEEKESDVNIASHIVLDSAKGNADCIVLLSNDTDLKMPLLIAKEQFQKIVGVISPYKTIHEELKNVSHFYRRIRLNILQKYQFSQKVGNIKRPPSWD